MQISILGCGWLGLPLAKHFTAQGYTVKGSTTREERLGELEAAGVKAVRLNLAAIDELACRELCAGSDVLVIAVPPGRGEGRSLYAERLGAFARYIPDQQNVLMVSSTSVYPNTNGSVDEAMSLDGNTDSVVLQAERVLRERLNKRLSILRLSGLAGYERLPGRFLAARKNLSNGDAPINLIHRDDCIGLIAATVEQEAWGEIINGCADKHPPRQDYYIEAASKAGLEPPEFELDGREEGSASWKLVSNDKSKRLLNYQYRYPDPFMFL